MFENLYRQSISVILSATLLSSSLSANPLTVDNSVPLANRPSLDTTANGVPLVNIVTPNASGMSHNKFSDFNVNPVGLILNNATTASQTQLGGWVQGNANLGTTPARVILNEVTGTSRTYLRGYSEVAGHAADVIIANPNGVTINGGGFINTPRATITTGTPDVGGGYGLNVRRGDILIEGDGMVSENIDRVDLYTKALQLNAQLHAKRLDVITGENDISADGSTYTPQNGAKTQEYSIDSSALGGIYANAITLIATDHGVGVNLPEITYASDSLTLNADGHIVLGAAVSDKTVASTSKSLTVNGLLRSGTDMDLKATDTLKVSSNSVILSGGDITIHNTGTVRNEAGRIEADNDLSIQAGAIENLLSMIPTKSGITISDTDLIYLSGSYRDWKTTTTLIESIDKTAYTPAYILAGNDMSLDGAIHNQYSMIAADRDLYLSGSLDNEAALNAHETIDITHYEEEYRKSGSSGKKSWRHSVTRYEHYDTIIDHVYSTISAGRSLLGNLATVNNADITTGSNYFSLGVAPTSYHRNQTTGEITYTLPDGRNGEYTLAADPALPYLIETNRLFTDYHTFVSSDYMMNRLNLNMASDTKRLGDARYETNLVRDAVFRLTGERRLAGFGTDTQQYQALMDNAINVAGNLQLALGVSLSSSQLAALDRDIVWMEERVVAGHKVLVPVVYLASLKNTTLDRGGKIIAGGDMALAVAGGLNNTGTIRAGGSLAAQSDSLTNTAGSITSNGDMLLHTTNDITNTSGQIRGNNVAILSDNGSITSQTDHKQHDLSNHTGTTGHLDTVGESAGIWAQGNLVASADKNINLVGGETAAGGTIDLTANNITLASLEQASHYKTQWNQGSSEIESVKQHAASINAGGNVNLNAAKDITVNSSNVTAGNNVNLTAGENVNVTASNNREFRDVQTTSKGFMRKKSIRDMTLKESVASSNLTGENITITSGKDTMLQAANLTATNNIQVDAGGDINLLAKAYREASLHQESKSSLGGLKKSMSLDSTDAVKLHEATVKTTAQNIILNSGKDINIVASQINAAADLQLKAFENLNIIAGEEIKSEKHEYKKTSVNLASIAGSIATYGLVNTGSAYTQETHTKDNYDTTAKSSSLSAGGNINANTGTTNIVGSNLAASGDVNIKADIGGINVASAQELHNGSTLDKKTEIKLTDAIISTIGAVQGLANDTKLKFNVATAQFDEATTASQSVTNKASSITSGKNVTLDSSDDLTIKGSNLQAQEDITLSSKTGNIAILESVDTTNTQSKEKHAKADVNLVVQNEYVETAVAVNNVVKAAEQLKKVKEDYSNYKRQLKGLEASLDTLKTDPQVSERDISNLQSLIALTKDDETYYIAAIAAATVDLASKTVIVAQQAEAARNSTVTYGFSAGIALDLKGSQSTTDTTATRSNASNLNGKNITIATDSTKETSSTISGSNVNATDTLNITTRDLNVLASTDTTSSNSDSKDISGSVSMTIYGASTGPQVSMGYGQNSSRSNSTTHTNSTLTGNNVNLTATNDASFKGATVRADDTLNVNVANNLTVESIQDTVSSSNHGFNISGGFGMGSDPAYSSSDKTAQGQLNQTIGLRTGNGKIESVRAGLGASNGRSFDTQTVLTSLTGENVNVTTGNKTRLIGSKLAATDNQGNDTSNFNLTTNTLTTENLTDTHYNSQSGFSVGANIGLTPKAKDPQPNTQNKEDKTTTTINSSRLAFNTSREMAVGKTLATLGNGTVTISDTANSSDITHLNRDVTQVDKELYRSSTGTKVDATLDTRMLTEEGRAQIYQQYKDMDKNMKAVADTLPNADSDNIIESVAGKVWDNVAAYGTIGILPSYGNNGGTLGEVPILSGNKDSVHKVLQVVNTQAPLYQEGKENFILLEKSDAYKMMSEEKQLLYKDKGLYISKEPVTITKDSATYQNGTNGIMNNMGLAVHNVMEQTGMLNQLASSPKTAIEVTVSYNPTRGLLADLLESAVDKLGGTTGIAKQTGEFIRDVTTQRGVDGSNFTMHSQGNIIAHNGIKYIQSADNTGAKFLSVEKFATGEVDKDGRAVYKTPTFESFGSPVNGKDMDNLIGKDGLGYDYKGAFTNEHDYVGQGLGHNSGFGDGSNEQASYFQMLNLIDIGRLFTDSSPHSGYDPKNWSVLDNVTGYKK